MNVKMSEETANMPDMYNLDFQIKEDLMRIPNIGKLREYGISIIGVGYHTEYVRTINGNVELLARVDNLPWDSERYGYPYQGSGVFGKTDLCEYWEDAVFATINALTEFL